jgi:hypothetical protein
MPGWSKEEIAEVTTRLREQGSTDDDVLTLLATGYVNKLLRVDGDDGDKVQTLRWVLGDPSREDIFWDVFQVINGDEKYYKCRVLKDGEFECARARPAARRAPPLPASAARTQQRARTSSPRSTVTKDLKENWQDHLALCK